MWKYQDLLNQNLQILIILAIGALSVLLKLVSQKTDAAVLNKLVFHVLLPASVCLGLGLRSNLRDGATWRFVGAFLMLRALCLLASIALVGFGPHRKGIGAVTMNWLMISWMSTVILGVPLLRAALGPQYSNLGVVAGISSFIFQLPVMLVMYEIHAGQKQQEHGDGTGRSEEEDGTANVCIVDGNPSQAENNNKTCFFNSNTSTTTATTTTTTPRRFLLAREQWQRIAIQLFKNPILWSILIGIILSVSTIGPKYLNPGNPPGQPNCDYAPGAGFISLTLTSLASCTEPIALFATGAFLVHRNPIVIGYLRAALYMFVKLIIVPALAVGCAFATGLEGPQGRAAVLIASLPISAAGFVLSSRYEIGEAEAVSNLFFGNLLILPTTLGWMAFMDAVDLFPVNPTAVPDVCAVPAGGGGAVAGGAVPPAAAAAG